MVMETVVISLNKENKIETPVVACIGFFDGLHLGHQALISKTLELAKKHHAKSALITFNPDPWVVIKDVKEYQHLSTIKRREELASKLGIDMIITLDFTKEMSALTPYDFLHKALVPCNLKALVCGFDFHYGLKGMGNPKILSDDAKEYFEVEVIDSVNEEDKKISTSRIVEYLEKGEIIHANRLLGYSYQVEGTVIHGQKRGREIGFPTANIDVDAEYIIPKTGIYEGWINVENEWYPAIINIGHNPTFNYSNKLSIEAHILNFNQQIYGQLVKLEFIKYLREEMKFNSIDELIAQMQNDKETAKKDLIQHEE